MPVRLTSRINSYTISNIEAGVSYKIEVAAKFDGYQQAGRIELMFQVPRKPDAYVKEITESSAKIEWSAPDIGSGVLRVPVNGYKLTLQKDEIGSSVHRAQLGGDARLYEFENLDAGSQYVVTLRANNVLGDGVPFTEKFTTDEPALEPMLLPTFTRTPTASFTPSPTPTVHTDSLDLSIDGLVSGGAIISWSIPTSDYGQLRGFELSWSVMEMGRECVPSSSRMTLSASSRSLKIPDIDAGCRYYVQLWAIFENTHRLTDQTEFVADVPGVPKLRIDSKSSTQVKITWEQPALLTGLGERSVSGFKISWSISPYKPGMSSVRLDANVLSHNIQGLLPSTTYNFVVVAYNGLGDSEAAVLSVTTDDQPITPTMHTSLLTVTPAFTITPIPTVAPTLTVTPIPTVAPTLTDTYRRSDAHHHSDTYRRSDTHRHSDTYRRSDTHRHSDTYRRSYIRRHPNRTCYSSTDPHSIY